MKFVCDSCSTKYSIADERVHGRVLKIRCKTCDHVITVREEMKPAEPAPAAMEPLGRGLPDDSSEHTVVSMAPPPSSAAEAKADEWYVSFDGEQEGPLPLAKALDRVRTERPKGREAHCWRPGFFVWLAVEEVSEFAPALERPRKVSSPPPMPAPVMTAPPKPRSPSGAQPALRSVKSPSGSQPVVKSPSGSQPVVKPATPQPAPVPPLLSPMASPMSMDPLPPLDSKPLALPPPPEPLKDLPLNLPLAAIPTPVVASDSLSLSLPDSIPSPMASQLTKPEPRLTRRALEEADKAAEPPRSKPEPLVPEISPFAAALAATTGQEAKQHDTGPVPLPPPPGASEDLAISEPSGLLSISHLAQAPSPLGRPSEKAVIDTFGGVAVTPPGQNGTSSAAPVVVVAGPAQAAAPWVKWGVAVLLVMVLALSSALIYLVVHKPVAQPVKPTVAETSTIKHVDDSPIQVAADPAPPLGLPTPADPTKKGPSKHANNVKPSQPPQPGSKPENLSAAQKNLAALYGDSTDKSSPKESAPKENGEKAQGQVSQSSILAVVTQNRRALNLCYDRVLKHDSSLKRARLVTHVKVGISGMVKEATVPDPEYANSEIGQCLTQTIKRWHFPPADAEYETEFPIILQAE